MDVGLFGSFENRAPTKEKQGCVSKTTGFPNGFWKDRVFELKHMSVHEEMHDLPMSTNITPIDDTYFAGLLLSRKL